MILAIIEMKKFSILLIILLMCSQFSITAISDTATNILYVDDDNTSGPWDGTEDYPFQHIQDGVDAAESGGTVFVCGGFYNEQTFINKTIYIQGESMDSTFIDGTELGRLCSIEEANNVKISGFTFQNAEPGAEALYLYHSTSVVIEYNRFTQNRDASIHIGGSNSIISENDFIDNPYGSNTIWVASSGNTLVNNTIENNKGSGISIVARNNTINGNVIKDNEEFGIVIFGYPYVSIKNIVISDNIIQGNNIGIRGSYVNSYIVITNNTIRENKRSGITFESRYSTISYNTFENNPIGLFQILDSNFNNVSHNTFSSNFVGIKTIQTTTNSYKKNNFIKNTIHASFFDYTPIWFYYDEENVFNSWDNNYWDNWKISRPKPIFGVYSLAPLCLFIPYLLFDQNPATEPFEIEA